MKLQIFCGGAIRILGLALVFAPRFLLAETAIQSATTASADQLVADALRAEVDGNLAKRRVLLNMAVDAQPENAAARWQSGQVRVGDQWMRADEAQDVAARDPRRIEYEVLRKNANDSLGDQAQLARWCDAQKLTDEAAFHWSNVLAYQPDNSEALRATDSCWYQGQRMTHAEVQAAKEEARAAKVAAKKYKPLITRWERLLAAGDVRSRDAALKEIRANRELSAIPAFETVTLHAKLDNNAEFERAMQMGLAFVAALDKHPEQAATDSLLRHAAVAPVESVRQAAAAALKRRSPHGYVPPLLSLLSMPFESSFRMTTDSEGGVHYWHSLYREGRETNLSIESRNSLLQHDFHGSTVFLNPGGVAGVARESDAAIAMRKGRVAKRALANYANLAAATEQQVAQVNAQTTALNDNVTSLLQNVTDQDFGDDPKAWWNWWDTYNEYSTDGEHPTEERRYVNNDYEYYRMPGYAPTPHSCFAAGTLVWTRTGLRPIESLEIGDFVLAQDIASGELRYKTVLGRTIRRARPTLFIQCGGEKIQATLGHPMWVAGKGWKMAKELQPGDVLHGVRQPVLVDSSTAAEAIDVFNLVVADDHCYFVGEAGILVHDNSPRGPVATVVPGLASAEGAMR